MLNSKPKELECVAVAVRPCLTRDQIGSNFYIKPAGCISRWVREGPIEFNEQCPLFDLRPDSMANLWRAPGNLRKSMEIPGEMDGNVRINENHQSYPTEFQQILTS